MILRGEVKFFGQSQFYGSTHFHVKLIKVNFFQTCRYQGQKVIGQCYDDRRCVFVLIKVQNWLSVVIKDTFIFNRSRWPPIQFPMLLRWNPQLLNLWIQIEFQIPFKVALTRQYRFAIKMIKKNHFIQNSNFLIGKSWSVVIAESNHNSETAIG